MKTTCLLVGCLGLVGAMGCTADREFERSILGRPYSARPLIDVVPNANVPEHLRQFRYERADELDGRLVAAVAVAWEQFITDMHAQFEPKDLIPCLRKMDAYIVTTIHDEEYLAVMFRPNRRCEREVQKPGWVTFLTAPSAGYIVNLDTLELAERAF